MNKKDILKQIENQVKEDAVKEEQKKEQKILDDSKKEQLQEKLNKDLEKRKEIDVDLNNIRGIGPLTIEKLATVGIYDIWDLATSNAPAIWSIIGDSNKSLEYCTNLIIMANRYLKENEGLDEPIVSSKYLLDNEAVRKRFSTGDEGLDNFFGGGGIESKAITELYGKFQTGKTQICYCTAITAASNNKKVLFIDTENTYSPTRTQEISILRGLDVNKVQENIHVSKVSSSSMLVSVIRDLRRLIKENKFELIIIDSIIALHRAEYLGRTFLASRQQGLAEIMGILIRIAERCNIGVIITNQVGDSPDPFKPGVYATGGNIIAHSSTHRIFLKSRGQKTEKIKGRNVKRDLSLILMQDSPRYPRTEKLISIGPDGVKVEDASKMDSKVISSEEEE